MRTTLFLILSLGLTGLLLVGTSGLGYAQTIESVDVVENKLVTLIGEGYDPDAEDLAYFWEQLDGEHVELSSYTIPMPQFMAPEVENGLIKVLTFQLTVTDPFGAQSSDIVEIIVNPVNHPPVVSAGRDKIIFPSINAITLVGSAVDADDDKLTFNWEQVSGPEIELVNTDLRYLTIISPSIDFTDFTPMTFRLTADDGFGGVGSDTATVYPYHALLQNRLISIDAGPLQTVREGETVTMDVTGTTSNGAPIRYSWAQLIGTAAPLNTYVGNTVQFIAPDLKDDAPELLSFQVTGYSEGNGWASDIALVRVLPFNGPPVADAGPDQTVSQNVFVNLVGSGTDPEDTKLKFQWSQLSGSEVTLHQRTLEEVYFVSPFIENDSEDLTFQLRVTDSDGNFDTDDVKVTVAKQNHPPKANAGPDRRVLSDSDVTVTGFGMDPDGDEITYAWKQISGDAVAFDGSDAVISFKAPTVQSGDTKRLILQLTVTDTLGQKDTDRVTLIVVPANNKPTVDAGPDQVIDENTVGSVFCAAFDVENDPLTYTWTSASSDLVIHNPSNPGTTFTAPSVVDSKQVELTCSVSDGTFTVSDSLTVTVQNTLSLSIVANAGPDQIVNEKVKVNLDGSASYDPENQSISYQWTQTSGESVVIDSSNSAKPSFMSPTVANNEIKVLVFELRVYDDNNREAFDTVIITVDPVNAPPVAEASAIQ
ncbi:MAG: peptidase [Nitrosopumilaceae archaeon]|nr:peptidase [Nitrosopumilaceae archaeon]NIP10598.1 peptidase [Nitrosopumilaceae archaeon]NIS94921.1 peptidase [Nitrosopumilaceae archaeon]